MWLNFFAIRKKKICFNLPYNRIAHVTFYTQSKRFPTNYYTLFPLHFQQLRPWEVCSFKVNLHWGVSRSSRARFFVCFVASGNSALVHGSARQLLGAIKQTKNRARLLLQLLSVYWPQMTPGPSQPPTPLCIIYMDVLGSHRSSTL